MFRTAFAAGNSIFQQNSSNTQIIQPFTYFIAFQVISQDIIATTRANHNSSTCCHFVGGRIDGNCRFTYIRYTKNRLATSLSSISISLFYQLSCFTWRTFRKQQNRIILCHSCTHYTTHSNKQEFPFSYHSIHSLKNLYESFFLWIIRTIKHCCLPGDQFSVFHESFTALRQMIDHSLAHFLKPGCISRFA